MRALSDQRSVTILGSTGSVGCSTIDLIERNRERYRVVALTANRNVALLAEQARRLEPDLAVVADPRQGEALAEALAGTPVRTAAGPEALVEAASLPVDWVMAAIVGAAGLRPTLAAVEQGGIVSLANKECLVCAGDLMIDAVRRAKTTLLPVDSEHNAIFQVFDFERPEGIAKIILTASGGPFRNCERRTLAAITPEEAVKHPNWSMGAKISVDSATMMNKGLEVIEAYHLFPLEQSQVEILVHPQSVIHSMVEYRDGSVLAQLGSPDMRTPIAHTLAWPARIDAPVERLDFVRVGSLDFEAPDPERFPALRLARLALQTGGTAPTILNAANEVAVDAFLNRRLGFLEMTHVVEEVLGALPARSLNALEDVYEADRQARERADGLVKALA